MMSSIYEIPKLPLPFDLETKDILKQVNAANKALAELKGVAQTIPNEGILVSALALQEAKDSSAIENIVTTHDELYKAELDLNIDRLPAATKEILLYREAIKFGFEKVRKNKIISNTIVKKIQEKLEGNNAGFRTVAGTTLKNAVSQEVVYTPPQDKVVIENAMHDLERFINIDDMSDIDPLIKVALIHHQFESIHPFYDGNGRTGRILIILYLVKMNLLELPILYLSKYIIKNRAQYYTYLQAIRDCTIEVERENAWQAWVLFLIKGIEITSLETITLIKEIRGLMQDYKNILRPIFDKTYKHELLNNLFFHPYTKIDFMARDLSVRRQTASIYLDKIVQNTGLLEKVKIGRDNYYINTKLRDLFIRHNSL